MSGWIQDRPRRRLLVRMLLASVAMLSTLSIPLFAAQDTADGATTDNLGDTNNGNNATLEIGIFPYLNTRTLLTTYQPLQQYLQNRLQRPVLFITAPDLHHVSELRGETIATPDGIAIISMLGVQLLRANDLKPGQDVVLRAMPSHDAAVLALQKGNGVAAAMVSATALQQMPQELRNSIRTLATSNAVPPIMYLAHPKTPRREVADMTRLLLEFTENTPEGRKFISEIGHLGLRPPSTSEMKRLDPYVSDLKTLLRKH